MPGGTVPEMADGGSALQFQGSDVPGTQVAGSPEAEKCGDKSVAADEALPVSSEVSERVPTLSVAKGATFSVGQPRSMGHPRLFLSRRYGRGT